MSSAAPLERLRIAAIRLPAWHLAIVGVGACGTIVAVCTIVRWVAGYSGHRVAGAGAIACLMLVATGIAALVARRLDAGRRIGGARAMAFALTALIAAGGLVVVSLLVLYPPPLEASAFKQWDYRDKRWLVALFVLASGVVYLPALVTRLLGNPALRELAPKRAGAPRRGLLALAAGGTIALLYVAPMLPGTTTRYLDTHEQVHLGGFQRIAQGAAPYLDARTQYGPGLQIVSYEMMRHSDFSVRGFRLSQAWLNIVALTALLAAWLFAYGWRLGTVVILASLAVSPLLVVTFWGWGWPLRWLAPALVGTLLPPLLWRETRSGARIATFAALGMASGALAWMAQENLVGAALATALLLGAAVARGVTPLRSAIGLGALFVGFEAATLMGLLVASFGLARLHEAWSLYTLSSGLVFEGMTNTAWSEPTSTWRRAYRLTPLAIIAITAAGLYLASNDENTEQESRRGQLLGAAAAAVPLAMLTLFRADSPHFIGPSTALSPLLVLAVLVLPGRPRWGVTRDNLSRGVLIAVFVAVYFNPIANLDTRIRNDRTFADPRRLANPSATLAGLRLLAGTWSRADADGPARSADMVERQLGFRVDPAAHCCHNNDWSFGEWAAVLRRIHADAAGRPTLVDVDLPVESSGIYFLANLDVATPYVSRIMSVWTDDDLRTVAADLAAHPPACVVSGAGARFADAVIARYPHATVDRIPGPAGLMVTCADPMAAAPTSPPHG